MAPQQFVRRFASGFVPAIVLAAWCAGAVAQHTERVSVDSSGGESNGWSWAYTALSADGRFVVFGSLASNLVPGDTNGTDDIFVRDRRTGVTERVSVDSAGVEGDQSSWGKVCITPDGRYVAFSSLADNLVSGDTNGHTDIFLRDRQTGTTERISVGAAGVEGDDESIHPSISDDGRYVVFTSYASNFVPSDTNAAADIFLRDRVNGTTGRMSLTHLKTQADDRSDWACISADGTMIAFESFATNLVANDNNGKGDVFVRDAKIAQSIQRVSVDSSGAEADFDCLYPSLSADGLFVAFSSWADNLVAGDTNNREDVFVRDVANGTTERVSLDGSGAQGNDSSSPSAISGDGRFVAFASLASNLVANDTNGSSDIFLRDRTAGTTARRNVSSTGVQSDGSCDIPSISRDGRYVAFDESGDNLVANDTNGVGDTFVHGPWLTLEASPPVCVSGTFLTFSTFTGSPGGLTLLVCSGVNGTATFVPIVLDVFDPMGVWIGSTLVPPGLAGLVLTFESFGIAPNGKVAVSNPTDVVFQ